MIVSTGARKPRATRSSRQPFHADHAQHRHAHDSSGTAHAQSEAIEVDVDQSRSASERARHASSPSFSVATTRETALLESGAALSNGWSAPRIRRVLLPAKYVATTASLT